MARRSPTKSRPPATRKSAPDSRARPQQKSERSPKSTRKSGGKKKTVPTQPLSLSQKLFGRHQATRRVAIARRTMRAGHVMQVCLVALLTGALLNAPGIMKTAEGQDLGWHRNLARAFSHPLASMSSWMQLDKPRAWMQERIGQEGADKIFNFAGPSPTVPVAGSTAPPVTLLPPPPKFFSPENQLTVFVAGDSLSKIPGDSLRQRADAARSVNVVAPVDYQVATGLSRPEVFYWPSRIQDQMTAYNPRVVVLTFGANDDQPLTGNGIVGPFGSQAWKDEYTRRVGGLMDALISQGRHVVLVGIPWIRNNERNARYAVLNEIYEREAKRREKSATFIDTARLFSPDGAGYSDFGPGAPNLRVRAADGIHFERAGGDYIADEILRRLDKRFDLHPPPR